MLKMNDNLSAENTVGSAYKWALLNNTMVSKLLQHTVSKYTSVGQ